MANSDTVENGGAKVAMSPTFLATLILLLLGGGGVGGNIISAFSSDASPSHLQADHDQITALGVEVRLLKDSVNKLDQRAEETNGLLRRLIYRGPEKPTVLN